MKEGSTKRQSAVWIFISGGVLIAAAIIALYTPWLQFCDVREVVVSGNRNATAAELVSLARLHRDQTIFSVPAAIVKQRLERHPWVKNASVRRVFPHTIQLVITERQVIAWAQNPADGGLVAIAEGGVIVETDGATSTYIQLAGIVSSGWAKGDRIHDPRVADLAVRLRSGVCQFAVRSVDATDLHSIELILENETHVLLGDIALAQDRLAAVEALCRAIEIDGYERIDVRFGGEATLVPRKAVRR